MKPITILSVGAMLGMTVLPAAVQAQQSTGPNRCIDVYRIQSTEVLDDQTILFHMRDRTTLKNVLPDRCLGLKLTTRGFSYDARYDELCGNLQSIRLNQTGATCALGSFTPYTPATPTTAPASGR